MTRRLVPFILWLLALVTPAHAAYECYAVPNRSAAAFAAQSRLFDQDLRILALAHRRTGVVYSGGGCLVTAQGSPAMSVHVAACTVSVAGSTASVSAGDVTIAAANATNPRIDLITANGSGTLAVTAGTPAASPEPPTIPDDVAVLAFVYVPAGDTAVNSNQIVDKRACLSAAGGGGASPGGSSGDLQTNDGAGGLDGFAGDACSPGDFATAIGTDGSLTCSTPSGGGTVTHTGGALTANRLVIGAGSDDVSVLGSAGTASTVLHGNAGGAPSFGSVVSADLNITTTSCTNQVVTAISAAAAGTCSTVANAMLANSAITINGTSVSLGGTRSLSLASSDFANQGTTTTVLHGNASGNPSFGAVSLTADVTGTLPAGNGGTASAFTAFTGPASSTKTFTLPNASSTILTDNAAVSVAQGGTGITSGTSGGVPYYSSSSAIASSGALTANLPVVGGGAGSAPTVGTRSGNTTKFVSTTGTLNSGNCAQWDASGNLIDSGGVCGGGSGAPTGAKYWVGTADGGLSAEMDLGALTTGLVLNTVSAGTGTPSAYAGTSCTNQFPRSLNASGAATCASVSMTADVTGTLGAGNGGTGSAFTAFSGPASSTKTFTLPNATSTILTDNAAVTVAQGGTGITSGTSGGIPYFSSSSAIASSNALTANAPVIGGGAGTAPTVGSRSGNTTTFATTSGTLTSGNCVKFDASGNLVDHGSTCGGGGGGVTTTGSPANGNLTKFSGAGTITNADLTGDVTTSGGVATTLANSGVSAGSYGGLTVDAKGRITAGVPREVWAVVTTDVTHTQSSTSLESITGLSFSACSASTEVWQWEIQLLTVAANNTVDWKFGMTVPTSASAFWAPHMSAFAAATSYFDPVATSTSTPALLTEGSTLAAGSAAVTGGVFFRGWLYCSTNSGTFQFQFAQNTSNASDITIKKGSFLVARRLIN